VYSRSDKSLFLAGRDALGIVTTRTYPVVKSIKTECVECGRRFVIDPGEQKWFARRGMDLPKRCQRCRERRITF
jgi:hypothetical protein